MSEKSSMFISYHHDDAGIAQEVRTSLEDLASKGKGKDELDVFLDIESITTGADWSEVINKNLGNHDWLVSIFTGEQSLYCGYEIATYMLLHEKPRPTVLYDVPKQILSSLFTKHQSVPVSYSDKVELDRDSVIVEASEANAWFNSPTGKFLQDFCEYKGLYTSSHEKRDPSVFKNNIALAAKRITNEFYKARGTDIHSDTPTQVSFEILINNQSFIDDKLERIPDEACIEGNTVFFTSLGLELPVLRNNVLRNNDIQSTTWGKLKQLLSSEIQQDVPWMHKVESDIARSVSAKISSGYDVTFRSENGKIFRPLLIKHTQYVNGNRRFYLVFAQCFDRRFMGSTQSSMLLTSLILASRWYFTYFEEWPQSFERVFGDKSSLEDFSDGCKQLRYNIEWIENEAAELGARDKKALVEAYGVNHRARVNRFFDDWEKSKNTLFSKLPNLYEKITSDNRKMLAQALLEFFTDAKLQNKEFLELAVEAYQKELNI